MKNIKKKSKTKQIAIMLAMLAAGILIGYVFFNGGTSTEMHDHEMVQEEESTEYTCSMHPQIRQDEPGLCPICAMDLVPVDTQGSDDEGIDPSEIQMTASAAELANIQTAVVNMKTPEKSIHLLGKVSADERRIAEMSARFGGRIDKLFVNYTGQEVRKGQKLASIYSPELITAQKELLEARKLKESNPGFYQAARNKLKFWDLSVDQINELERSGESWQYFDILAPITGTVTKRYVSAGQYVKEGTPLFEVVDLSKLWVLFEAYEKDLPWIHEGDSIAFTLEAIPGKTYNAGISYVDPLIDPASRVAMLRVEVDNADLDIKPGMFAKGMLSSAFRIDEEHLVIPRSAVLWTGKRAVVYVKVEERDAPTFIYREIVLGPEAGDEYVVFSGLEEGEEIVMNGVFKVDAAAQLAGKPSMMNPGGGKMSTGRDHGSMGDGKSSDHEHMDHASKDHAMIKVLGNCGMCKDRIETAALELEGVAFADWDQETKMLHLDYDKSIVELEMVEKAIAAVGHDTEHFRAPDDVYEELHACCLYDRDEMK